MKLSTKIIIIILQTALVPWAFGGTLAYLSSQEQINNKTFTDLDAFVGIQKNRLEDTLQNKEDILNLFAKSPRLTALFRDYNAQPSIGTRQEVQNLLETAGSSPGIRRVYVVTVGGTVTASTDRTLVGTEVNAEDYFKLGLHRNDISVLKKDASGNVSHYLTGPLVYDGRTEGVVVIVTDADDIVSISQDYTGLGSTGETLLVRHGEKEGDVLFLTPTRFDPAAAFARIVKAGEADLPVMRALADQEAVFANLLDYRGVPVYAATRHLGSVGWGLVVKIDQEEAHAPVKKLRELFFSIILLVGFLMVFIGISIARSITGPIKALTQFANRIAAGDLRQSIVSSSKDEVGILASAFNSMTVRLQESHATLEQKVAERTTRLAKKTQEAQDSQKAALNIAADLRAEEGKLIMEKTKAEMLANDLKKFKLALDNTSDQVIITDAEGIVVYANAAVEKITGYKPEEVLGKKSGSLWKSPMPLEYYQSLWRTIKTEKKTFIGEIRNKRKNGGLYTATISISPVLDDAGNIIFFVGLERDITREKEIDTVKSEFISLASHQLRTPLTAVNWYAEMLLGGDAGKLSIKQKNYFNEIYAAGRQMNEIIKSFLHILRLEAGTVSINPVALDLVGISRAVIKESLDIEKKHLRIIERYQESLPTVHVDKELVRVVLQNLVTNAIKYTREKGEIRISLDNMKKGTAIDGKTAEGNSLVISVHDTGIGIATKDRDKVFDKFFRSENAKRMDPNGNGLGLYMARKMVDIIGGKIWFESEEGKGTTFYVLLPVDGKNLI